MHFIFFPATPEQSAWIHGVSSSWTQEWNCAHSNRNIVYPLPPCWLSQQSKQTLGHWWGKSPLVFTRQEGKRNGTACFPAGRLGQICTHLCGGILHRDDDNDSKATACSLPLSRAPYKTIYRVHDDSYPHYSYHASPKLIQKFRQVGHTKRSPKKQGGVCLCLW